VDEDYVPSGWLLLHYFTSSAFEQVPSSVSPHFTSSAFEQAPSSVSPHFTAARHFTYPYNIQNQEIEDVIHMRRTRLCLIKESVPACCMLLPSHNPWFEGKYYKLRIKLLNICWLDVSCTNFAETVSKKVTKLTVYQHWIYFKHEWLLFGGKII
jgi:hypothetical protein